MEDDKKSRKPRMDGEIAMALAGEEFEKRHPRETWPEWLSRCTVLGYSKDKQGRFIVSLTASVKEPLDPDEHWEEIDGRKHIVSIDPETQEKYIVFRTPREFIVCFEAAVDPETAEVTVLIDRGFSGLVGEELLGF